MWTVIADLFTLVADVVFEWFVRILKSDDPA